jgi:phosphate-selective porin OprO/OprP
MNSPTLLRSACAAAFAVLGLAQVPGASAQSSPFASERPAEAAVRPIQATSPAPAPAPVGTNTQTPAAMPSETPAETTIKAEPGKTPILGGWDNGFILRSADDRFQLRLTGQIQSDYRAYMNQIDTADLPTFLVRRARLGIEATVAKYYEFRMLPDFGLGQPKIADSYLNIHYWDEFQLEVGKFKQPFSFEQLIQDRYVPLMERSLIDQLVPARDVGLMVHGQKLLDDRLDYGFSMYGGVQNGDGDNDRNREGAGRVAIRPFRGFGLDLIDGLQLGIAGTIGEDEGAVAPQTLRTPASVPWFRFNDDVRPNGLRYRWSPEVVYICGPMSLSSQYYYEAAELQYRSGTPQRTNTDFAARGFYVMGTVLVTGEKRTSLSQAIDPIVPFDPVNGLFGTGAIELVGRVSYLSLSADTPQDFDNLYDPVRSAPHAREITTGFNWYLNKYVRFQFNWEYARFANPVKLGDKSPKGNLDHQNSFLGRFQVIF